jgi:hypothetical protein
LFFCLICFLLAFALCVFSSFFSIYYTLLFLSYFGNIRSSYIIEKEEKNEVIESCLALPYFILPTYLLKR